MLGVLGQRSMREQRSGRSGDGRGVVDGRHEGWGRRLGVVPRHVVILIGVPQVVQLCVVVVLLAEAD
jgi:hypothetical protein